MANKVVVREERNKMCEALRDMPRTNLLRRSTELLLVSSLSSSRCQYSGG